MGTPRHWVYGQLTTYPSLIALIGEEDPRVFAKKSMTSAIELHPYLVYKLGYEANEELSEELDISRQFIQVWVHDFSDGETADYEKIDAVITQVKAALRRGSSAQDGVIYAKWIETSQDLNDETLNTVFKYARFQLITKEQ